MIGVNGAFLVAPMTGVQRFAFQLLLGLLEARPDLRIRVYVPPLPESKEPLLAQLRAAGAEIRVGPASTRGKQLFEQVGLPLLARKDGVTCLVHLNNNVSIAYRGRQVCFVYDIASMRLPRTYRLAYRIKFRATIAAIRWRKPSVVTLSEFSRSELKSVGVKVGAIVTAGVGSPMLMEAEPAAAPLSIEGPYALIFGSADPRKRVEAVVASWAPVYATLGLTLVVVQGVAPTHRQSTADDAVQQGVIRVGGSGRISDGDLVALTRGAALVVFASQYEGGALAAEEVLALGTPVVVSDIPTFRELLAPPVSFFHDLTELRESCTQVLAAPRPAAYTLEQVRQAWRDSGSRFADVIFHTSAEPADRGRPGNYRG